MIAYMYCIYVLSTDKQTNLNMKCFMYIHMMLHVWARCIVNSAPNYVSSGALICTQDTYVRTYAHKILTYGIYHYYYCY